MHAWGDGMDSSLFAYSLSQAEEGWAWRLYDENGDIVAAGSSVTRADAEQSVSQAYGDTDLFSAH